MNELYGRSEKLRPYSFSARKGKSTILPLLTKSGTYAHDFGRLFMACTDALTFSGYPYIDKSRI